MEEVIITVEAKTMAETMHRMEMVVEIINIIVENLSAVQENLEHFII